MKYFTVMLSLVMIFVSCESSLSPESGSTDTQHPSWNKSGIESVSGEVMESRPLSEEGSWELQQSDASVPLLSVHFVDAQNGWTVGLRSNRFGPATFQGTLDGGVQWQQQQIATPRTLRSVFFLDNQTGWVLRDSVAILHTGDGGQTWKQQYNDSGNLHDIHIIESSDGMQGWATGERGRILHTTDGGENWSEQESGVSSTTALRSVHFVDDYRGWIVGAEGTILHTRDGGKNWDHQESGITSSLRSVYFIDSPEYGLRGWATGDYGSILFTDDGGENWRSQESGTENYLNSVHFVDAQNGWAVGGRTDETTILRTTNGGESWLPEESGVNSILFSVYFIDAYNGWAVGNHGTILHYQAVSKPDHPLVDTPEQGLEWLAMRVNELWDERVLTHKQAKGLLAKLEAASRQVDKAHYIPAKNQLGAFINQVESFQVNGMLSEKRAGELVPLAEKTISMLTEEGSPAPIVQQIPRR